MVLNSVKLHYAVSRFAVAITNLPRTKENRGDEDERKKDSARENSAKRGQNYEN